MHDPCSTLLALTAFAAPHGGHPDLGVLHALWHAAPWLLGVAVLAGGYALTRRARTRRERR